MTLVSTRVVVTEHGAPEVMTLESSPLDRPGAHEVTVRHHAVGINIADTYFRSGLYPGRTPHGLGVEGAGEIIDVGADVTGFSVGDRVTYTGSPLGAYSDIRNMPTDSLIHLPGAITFDVAAASTMRGLTASYLLKSIWDLEAGDTVLMHAAAGGVGLIFCQMAAAMGLNVIGTVSNDEKKPLALSAGCVEVLNTRTEDVAARVREMTGGKGARMVVDGVGASTFESSLASVARRGLVVCLGTASGPVPAVEPPRLMRQGSVFLTRPAMADYIADPSEKQQLVNHLFAHLTDGSVRVSINQRWQLSDAVAAHAALESGTTTGSSIFEFTNQPQGDNP